MSKHKSDQNENRQPAMSRRGFVGALGAVSVAVGASGCISATDIGSALEQMGVDGADELLSRLAALVDTAPESLISTLLEERGELPPLEERTESYQRRLQQADRVARRLVVGLSVLGVLREIEPEVREESSLRSRIEAHHDSAAEAVVEATHLIATCPHQERQAVQAALRQDADIAMGLMGALQADGRTQGLPRSSGRLMRGLGLELNRVAREGELVALMENTVANTESALASAGVPWSASEWGLPIFWQEEQRMAKSKEMSDLSSHRPNNARRARRLIIAGAVLASLFGVTAIAFAPTDVAPCVSIPAAVICLIGLILLFVGLGQRRASRA